MNIALTKEYRTSIREDLAWLCAHIQANKILHQMAAEMGKSVEQLPAFLISATTTGFFDAYEDYSFSQLWLRAQTFAYSEDRAFDEVIATMQPTMLDHLIRSTIVHRIGTNDVTFAKPRYK